MMQRMMSAKIQVWCMMEWGKTGTGTGTIGVKPGRGWGNKGKTGTGTGTANKSKTGTGTAKGISKKYDAARIVAGFPLTGVNYEHSVTLLRQRYGQPHNNNNNNALQNNNSEGLPVTYTDSLTVTIH